MDNFSPQNGFAERGPLHGRALGGRSARDDHAERITAATINHTSAETYGEPQTPAEPAQFSTPANPAKHSVAITGTKILPGNTSATIWPFISLRIFCSWSSIFPFSELIAARTPSAFVRHFSFPCCCSFGLEQCRSSIPPPPTLFTAFSVSNCIFITCRFFS